MTEPVWLSVPLVRVMHAELIAEHGGETGIRDEGLLESALQRPRQAWAYGERDPGVLASRYAHGLASNHPFVDGNKRIALVALDVFLLLNERALRVSEADAYAMMMALAAGRLDDARLAEWVKGALGG